LIGLVCSDIHARQNRPRCRVDGGKLIGEIKANEAWQESQRNDLEFISNIANEKECQLIAVGDIFNKAHVPDPIVNDVIGAFSKVVKGTRILCGNHDLPGHNFKNIKESSIGILWKLTNIDGSQIKKIGNAGCYANFNEKIKDSKNNPDILFIHRLVFETKSEMPPNTEAIIAQELLDEYPDKKWIFVGDMHRGFHYKNGRRHVINCGCINRQSADEKDYSPSIWYVDTEKEIVERIRMPDDSELVDDSYLRNEKDRNEKLSAFAEAIKTKKNGKFSLSFDKNIENELEKNKKTLGEAVVNEVLELMEGDSK
jgi:hypothetical protein